MAIESSLVKNVGTDDNSNPLVIVRHSSGASATIYFHGATITSFKTSGGEEMLFLRCAIVRMITDLTDNASYFFSFL